MMLLMPGVDVGQAREPSYRMRKLGRLLKELRVRVGLTQQEAAQKLRFSDKKVSRIEQGQLPGYHELEAMLDLYQLTVSEWEPIIELWERAQQRPSQPGVRTRSLSFHRDDHGYSGLEADASIVRDFQLGYISGLMQTDAYSRCIFRSGFVSRSETWIDQQVSMRLRRQQRLFDDEPLLVHSIMDETVLRCALPADVMARQLR